MKKKLNFYKLTFILSILSLTFLFFLTKCLDAKESSVKEVYRKSVGEWVKISGDIKSIKDYKTFTLLEVCDEDCIVVVSRERNCGMNDAVEIVGKIIVYKGKKEIEAKGLRCYGN
jgi:aspartyl/asparaginyl-tRNA synthetase